MNIIYRVMQSKESADFIHNTCIDAYIEGGREREREEREKREREGGERKERERVQVQCQIMF